MADATFEQQTAISDNIHKAMLMIIDDMLSPVDERVNAGSFSREQAHQAAKGVIACAIGHLIDIAESRGVPREEMVALIEHVVQLADSGVTPRMIHDSRKAGSS